MTLLHNTFRIGVLCAFALALLAPFASQAATYEEALAQVQYDILNAYYRGDTTAMNQHFLVYFELLTLAEIYGYTDDGEGYYTNSTADVQVDTESATSVDRDDAKLRAEVNLSGDARAYVWFEYGRDEDDLDQETSREYVTRDSDVSANVDGLRSNTDYYFQAVAEDRDTGALHYGGIEDFETDGGSNGDVDVETLSAKNIDGDEATLRGELTDGGNNVEVWFAFDEDDSTPSCSSSSQKEDPDGDDEVDEDDVFELDIDGLDEGDRYYYRACAEDDDGDEVSGSIKSFVADSSNDDEPDVDTDDADNVEDHEAELNGSVDMNDFNNGIVFFVWGEDEDQVDDIANDYDTYSDIDEDGDDLQKQRVDSDLDGQDDYSLDIDSLNDDTDHFFAMCVEYEDDDNDEIIMCGNTEEFETDN